MGRRFKKKPKRVIRLNDLADAITNLVQRDGFEVKAAVSKVIEATGASTLTEQGGYLQMLRPALKERGITI